MRVGLIDWMRGSVALSVFQMHNPLGKRLRFVLGNGRTYKVESCAIAARQHDVLGAVECESKRIFIQLRDGFQP